MIPLNSLNHISKGDTCDDRPLLGGAAVSFDGVNAYMITQNRFIIEDVETYTIKSKIKINSVSSGFRWLLGLSLAGNNRNRFGLFYDNSNLKIMTSGTLQTISTNFTSLIGNIIDVEIIYNRTNINGIGVVNYNIGGIVGSFNSSSGSGTLGCPVTLGCFVESDAVTPRPNTYTDVNIYSFELSNSIGLICFYKLDEMNLTTAYDSSGNSYNGTLNGGFSYISTSEYSYRDNLGYSDGTGANLGVYIPRDESNINYDVLSNNLEFKGKACALLI